jgi:hypothetical protein
MEASIQLFHRNCLAETAWAVTMASYGIMVQNTPLSGIGDTSVRTRKNTEDDNPSTRIQPVPPSSPVSRVTPVSAGSPASATETAEAGEVLARLRLLVVSINPRSYIVKKSSKLIRHWPATRGVPTDDYTSSIAEMTESQFAEIKRKRQISQERRDQRHASRQLQLSQDESAGWPASSQVYSELPPPRMSSPTIEIRTSQPTIPSSNPNLFAQTMSQPVAGLHGQRLPQKQKPAKKRAGFR